MDISRDCRYVGEVRVDSDGSESVPVARRGCSETIATETKATTHDPPDDIQHVAAVSWKGKMNNEKKSNIRYKSTDF